MSDNRFSDVLGLLDGRGVLFQEVESEQTAVEFKGEEGRGDVLFCGANIMEKTGEEECLVEGGR